VQRSIFGTPPKEFTVNYLAHEGQQEISAAIRDNFASAAPAAIVEIIASRGWGKTLYLCAELLAPYMEAHPNAKVMWVAPTYQIALSPIEDVFKGTDELTGKRWIPDTDSFGNKVWEFATTVTGPVLRWYNGATVTFKSADAPESIVSRGYNLIIIDEAALIQERVFTQQILGTARKAGIKIFMITSPRGKKHWTYKTFCKGQDKKETNYLSFQQPYTKNPHFNTVLASLIKDLPDWIYRQEYMAEFIDDGDSVFRNLENCIAGPEVSFESQQQEWAEPVKPITVKGLEGDFVRKAEDRRFVTSLDLAKSQDYTVIWVMDLETGACVYYRRLNKTDYREVIRVAVEVCHKYNNAELIFDATGVGGGIADFLENYDVTAHPYVFTNESKNDLINRLILSMEYGEIQIPNIQTVKNELSVFTYTLTRTGKISYNAPSGFHDDIVIAIALANWFRKESGGADEVTVLEDIIKMNESRGSKPGSFLDYMDQDND
jgi:hypothetical protein